MILRARGLEKKKKKSLCFVEFVSHRAKELTEGLEEKRKRACASLNLYCAELRS